MFRGQLLAMDVEAVFTQTDNPAIVSVSDQILQLRMLTFIEMTVL